MKNLMLSNRRAAYREQKIFIRGPRHQVDQRHEKHHLPAAKFFAPRMEEAGCNKGQGNYYAKLAGEDRAQGK